MAMTLSPRSEVGARGGGRYGVVGLQPKVICYKNHKTMETQTLVQSPSPSPVPIQWYLIGSESIDRIRGVPFCGSSSAKSLDSSRIGSRCYYFIIIYKMHVLYTTYESAVVAVVVEVVVASFVDFLRGGGEWDTVGLETICFMSLIFHTFLWNI